MSGFRKDGGVDFRRIPKIVERPLRRHGADGLATHLMFTEPGEQPPSEPIIEIDTGLRGRLRLETILHEALHLALPSLPEASVMKVGRYLSMVAWKMGYRSEDDRED